MTNWYEGLNPEQVEAVAHNHGPMLILAGAGSGKTTVLVARAGRLIDEQVVSAERQLVLTFTNKAARELKHRVSKKVGQRAKGLWAGTFHAFGLQLLKKFYKEARLPKGFGVLDPSDSTQLAKELLGDFHTGDKSAYDAYKLVEMIGSWRESGQTAAKTEDEYEEAVEWLLPKYETKLKSLGMVDFDSLILKPLELINESDALKAKIEGLFDQVMVDEFQDTNKMQMAFVRGLSAKHHNLTVVGDDDQSIYGWRGACITNILNFPKLFSDCRTVRLERNYRSTPEILSLANAVIAKNTNRHAKILRAASSAKGNPPESFAYETEDEEAEGVGNEIARLTREGTARSSIAVLYRSNGQGALLEAELRKQGILYKMSGGTAFFDKKEIRDVLALLRSALRPNEISLRRILNTPPRGIGDKTVEAISSFAEQNKISFAAAVPRWAEADVDPKAGGAIDLLLGNLKALPDVILAPGNTCTANFIDSLLKLGYKTYLEKTSPNALSAAKRWKGVEIFAGILEKFVSRGGRTKDTLEDFLSAMELRDAPDDDEEQKDAVQLLTLHACKGLEFPVVFLIGCEEDLLPHKTLGQDVSEERRLFYVGVTRAKNRLILSRAKKRKRHGRVVDVAPSRFLLEIPKELISVHEGPRPVNETDRKAMIADLFKKWDQLGV